jgi:hypothetical protein
MKTSEKIKELFAKLPAEIQTVLLDDLLQEQERY